MAIVDRQSGVIHFLFCAEYARCYYVRSKDDGQTWTEAVDITATFDAFRPDYDWRVLATGPGHGIQLQNGRLLVPVWLSTGTGGHAHRPVELTRAPGATCSGIELFEESLPVGPQHGAPVPAPQQP